MSDSYPTIEDSLSELEQEFMGCVEMHVDPPEHDSTTYEVEGLFATGAGERVRFTVAIDETDPDISERRHSIEFLDLGAKIEHSMKRIEAWQGRFFWTESRFLVDSPEFPSGPAPRDDVEREVATYVERVRELDRTRSLVEL